MVIEKFTSHVILYYSANFEVNTKKRLKVLCCTYVLHRVNIVCGLTLDKLCLNIFISKYNNL
jgi:hypothetical protein